MKRTFVEKVLESQGQHSRSVTVHYRVNEGELSKNVVDLIIDDINKVATEGTLTIHIESVRNRSAEEEPSTATSIDIQQQVMRSILTQNRLTTRNAAKMVAVSPVTINNLRHGKGQMQRKTAEKILKAASKNALILSAEALDFLQSRI